MVTIRKDLPLRALDAATGQVMAPGSESEVDLEHWIGGIGQILRLEWMPHA